MPGKIGRPQADTTQKNLTFDKDVFEKLVEQAEKENRSISGMVNHIAAAYVRDSNIEDQP